MQMLIRIIGILIILVGVVFLLRAELFREVLNFFKGGKRVYIAGVLRMVLAVLFLVGATQCRIPKGIIVIGVLVLLSSFMIFTLKLDKLKAMIEWWQKRSSIILRIIALIAVAFGALIVYFA